MMSTQDCTKVDPNSSGSPLVCIESVSTGTTGVQGIVGIISMMMLFMLLALFISKHLRKRRGSIGVVNPYEEKTQEPYKPAWAYNEITPDTPKEVVRDEGWYATPSGDQDRYWDGENWTEQYRPHVEPMDLSEGADEDSEKISRSRLSPEEIEEYLEAESRKEDGLESEEGSTDSRS